MNQTIREMVRAVIAEEACVPLDQVHDESRLHNDLGFGRTIGAVEFVDLGGKLEKKLGLKIPAERMPGEYQFYAWRVSDVYTLFEELAAATV